MKLRPYQEQARDFLSSRPHAGLFMDMGLGKTAATLHALKDLPKPILLVGPIRVIETVWRQEAAKWGPTEDLTFSTARGAPTERAKALKIGADIYLTNREMLPHILPAKKWQTLVVDESSMFKNPSTKGFKILRKALAAIPHRYILTGTPTPNSLLDLWSQVFILDQGLRLGRSFYAYRQRFFTQTDWQGYKFDPLPGAREKIMELISDIVLRIEAKGNLPDREVLHNVVSIPLPPAARKAYREMEQEALTVLSDSEVTASTAAVVSMKLRQLASGFIYDDEREPVEVHTEKIAATLSVIDQTGSPVIVVYNFRHELAALKKALPDAVEFSLEIQEQWDAGEVPVMFLHPQSGGHGLNLQYGGHTMVIFSGSFSYEHMSQTKARIDRQGQTSPVVFHYLTAKDTIDELLLQVVQAKADDQKTTLDLLKGYALAKVNSR